MRRRGDVMWRNFGWTAILAMWTIFLILNSGLTGEIGERILNNPQNNNEDSPYKIHHEETYHVFDKNIDDDSRLRYARENFKSNDRSPMHVKAISLEFKNTENRDSRLSGYEKHIAMSNAMTTTNLRPSPSTFRESESTSRRRRRKKRIINVFLNDHKKVETIRHDTQALDKKDGQWKKHETDQIFSEENGMTEFLPDKFTKSQRSEKDSIQKFKNFDISQLETTKGIDSRYTNEKHKHNRDERDSCQSFEQTKNNTNKVIYIKTNGESERVEPTFSNYLHSKENWSRGSATVITTTDNAITENSLYDRSVPVTKTTLIFSSKISNANGEVGDEENTVSPYYSSEDEYSKSYKADKFLATKTYKRDEYSKIGFKVSTDTHENKKENGNIDLFTFHVLNSLDNLFTRKRISFTRRPFLYNKRNLLKASDISDSQSQYHSSKSNNNMRLNRKVVNLSKMHIRKKTEGEKITAAANYATHNMHKLERDLLSTNLFTKKNDKSNLGYQIPARISVTQKRNPMHVRHVESDANCERPQTTEFEAEVRDAFRISLWNVSDPPRIAKFSSLPEEAHKRPTYSRKFHAINIGARPPHIAKTTNGRSEFDEEPRRISTESVSIFFGAANVSDNSTGMQKINGHVQSSSKLTDESGLENVRVTTRRGKNHRDTHEESGFYSRSGNVHNSKNRRYKRHEDRNTPEISTSTEFDSETWKTSDMTRATVTSNSLIEFTLNPSISTTQITNEDQTSIDAKKVFTSVETLPYTSKYKKFQEEWQSISLTTDHDDRYTNTPATMGSDASDSSKISLIDTPKTLNVSLVDTQFQIEALDRSSVITKIGNSVIPKEIPSSTESNVSDATNKNLFDVSSTELINSQEEHGNESVWTIDPFRQRNSDPSQGVSENITTENIVDSSAGDVHSDQWPVKHSAVVEGDLVLGGLMMVHEREDTITCGRVMPQGGVQALEAMLYTLDTLNDREIVPGVKIGAHILDDCDKDTYGLEMAVDFIKESPHFLKDDIINNVTRPKNLVTFSEYKQDMSFKSSSLNMVFNLTQYTFRNNELQPTSVRRSDDRLANLEVQEQRNFQRRSHVEVFNYTKSWRFVTEQFKLAACTIPPAGSKLGRPIKISDSRVVTELIVLDNSCLDTAHRRHQSRSMEPNGLIHHLSWPVKKEAVVEGDLVLGGLMMVHEREDTVTCGPVMPQGGVQALEAMLYTLDILNQREIVPGVKIGAHILDDCDKDTYGLEMAVDFIKGSISNIDGAEYHCNKTAVRKVISGVVGAASSVTSIQVANLLRLFKIPQVSFFSTSPELSNKQRFEYFSRTIPSDHYQVKAMVDIVLTMGWSYVSIIYEESNYGVKAFEELEELLGKYNICIAVKEKLVKDSGVAEEVAYDEIVSKLLTKPRARGCIIFGSDQEVAGVMRAVRRRKATRVFSWIGSDGWSARGLVSNGNEPEVEGTLSVQPQANPVKGFEEYFLNLTVENNRRNPWFVEFWEDHFKCQYPNAPRTPYNVNYTRNCTTKERLTKQNTAFEDQLQFVSDAVMAFAYAFRDMHLDLCHGKAGLCDEMKPINGTLLLQYLRHVDFEGLSGDKFKFDKDGDGPARYNIIHFKQTERGKYKWIRVGKYLEGELRLNMSEIQFKLGQPQPPESVCSLPCEVGQAKKYVEGERCCWHCFNCTQYQIRHPEDETQCMQCERGTLPDETHSMCQEVPEEFLRPESGWAIGAMSFSATGMLVTLFVCGVFLKHNDTPVVRASGRELSYVLLSGILLCYLVTFTLIFKPTHIVCGIQRFAAGFCFTVVYAALLTKTNRISRIFNAGSAKRPSFISPRSQLIICSGLISVQILINIVWMIIDPARAMHHYPTMEDNLLVCNNYIDTSYMIAFTYPIILIIVCTIYAILTRKIPEAFNESKHIGLTMYTTCVIWLAFVPLYYGTGSNVALRITSMSVTISLSASVTVVCLFSPKLYIILIRPERNVRPTVRAGRPNPTKSSAITATNASSMIGPVTATTVLTAATCDQNKAIKKHIASTMDCSTQSECYEMETKERKNGDSLPTCISRSTQTTVNEKELVTVVTSNKKSPDVIVSASNMESINNTTTKRINSNARIGNGPLSQSDVSL
ncbi:Metabotropic glutamate receptor [Trachymyrmex zeteki]|uniref:Metabotropic glutamate receptor n=1 Tax=Mycetomoellerius zeteki TaxID=64791 RepID=A0A151WWG1_9HYME|nr:Metabotropic glutamate receptor [Trachymyrmex zeteki]